jgi:Dolichyl-phosphate-mannose-protein mannosyltransferase
VNAPSSQPARRSTHALLFGGAALVIISLHFATNATLGFHTDEFYYIAAGNHPAFGYVDFPPIVPLLARLETGLLGVSPWKLRVLPSVLGGVLVILCGLYVRRLGGSLRLQALALLIGLTAPYLVGSNWVFQTVTFDQVMWVVALYWFLAVVIDRRPRDWLALGMTLGLGLEVKYTVVGLVAGIGLAVVLTPSLRAALQTRYPWIAAGTALLIWSPNLAWQAVNGFPSLAYVANHQGSVEAEGGVAVYLIYWALVLALLLPVWLAGMGSLFRSARLRSVAIACAVPIVLFLFVGKSYYAMGTIPVVMAQGLMAISRLRRRRVRVGLEAAVAVASVLDFLVLLPLLVPVTPPDRLHAAGLDTKNEVFADSVGWEDIAQQVTTIYENLPAPDRNTTVIVSKYYGVPGALQLYSHPNALPVAVSPQLSGYYWLPNDIAATNALLIDYRPAEVDWMCNAPTMVAQLTVPFQVKGIEQGAPVTFCPLTAPLPTLWPRLRNFS